MHRRAPEAWKTLAIVPSVRGPQRLAAGAPPTLMPGWELGGDAAPAGQRELRAAFAGYFDAAAGGSFGKTCAGASGVGGVGASLSPVRRANSSTMITARAPSTKPPIAVIQKLGLEDCFAGKLSEGLI